MVDLAVVVVHGLGSQRPDYADGLRERVSRRLRKRGVDPDTIAWESIFWADLIEPRQRDYLRRARQVGPLRWLWLREQVVRGLGDAAAYRNLDRPTPTYAAIHDRIRERISALYAGPLGSRPVPMVVLAHSLGSHIVSSYVWDTQRGRDTGADPAADPFERMQRLTGLITFGSPIPLFTFAHEPVLPIAFPDPALPPDLARRARWLNLYDPDDVMGYPLRPLSPQYAATVEADVRINVGGLLRSWNPASHLGYWTDRQFVGPVTDQLVRLLPTG